MSVDVRGFGTGQDWNFLKLPAPSATARECSILKHSLMDSIHSRLPRPWEMKMNNENTSHDWIHKKSWQSIKAITLHVITTYIYIYMWTYTVDGQYPAPGWNTWTPSKTQVLSTSTASLRTFRFVGLYNVGCMQLKFSWGEPIILTEGTTPKEHNHPGTGLNTRFEFLDSVSLQEGDNCFTSTFYLYLFQDVFVL